MKKGGEEKHVQLHFKLREDDQFRLDQLPFRSHALSPISRTFISSSFSFRVLFHFTFLLIQEHPEHPAPREHRFGIHTSAWRCR